VRVPREYTGPAESVKARGAARPGVQLGPRAAHFVPARPGAGPGPGPFPVRSEPGTVVAPGS